MVTPTAYLWTHTQKIFNQKRFKPFYHKDSAEHTVCFLRS